MVHSTFFMQYAAGSSFAIMIATSSASVFSNFHANRIDFDIVKKFIGWTMAFTILGCIFTHYFSSKSLSLIFSGIAALIL